MPMPNPPICQSEFCSNLDKLGVPHDSKWRTLFMYVRGLQEFNGMGQGQKAELQTLLLEVLQEKDFSEERLNEVTKLKDEILYRPWRERLSNALSETARLLAEAGRLSAKNTDSVRDLESETVDIMRCESDLEAAIRKVSSRFEATIAELEQDAKRFKVLSHTDALTDLPNRRAFDSHLADSLTGVMVESRPLALLMIDVDRFKAFNDTYGHLIGDQALRSVATLLNAVRGELDQTREPHPMAARFGGEEFAFVLPDMALPQAMETAEEVRKRVAGYGFVIRDAAGMVLESDVRVTVSVGVAEMTAHCEAGASVGDAAMQLVHLADLALYAAKDTGRNRVCSVDDA